MNQKAKIVEPDEPWESREVGAQEEFVEVAPDISKELDAALDLHPISIRLQKSLVDNLKALAHLHGLGYQPLVRQVLTRWVDSELKQLVARRANEKAADGSVKAAAPKMAATKMAATKDGEVQPVRHKRAA